MINRSFPPNVQGIVDVFDQIDIVSIAKMFIKFIGRFLHAENVLQSTPYNCLKDELLMTNRFSVLHISGMVLRFR